MTSKNSKARLKAKEERRSSYPLCLVCEYDHDYEEESIHQLYEKFQRGALHFEELDNEVRMKANHQKSKVLDALWKMDLQSRQRIADEIRRKNDEEIRSQGKKHRAKIGFNHRILIKITRICQLDVPNLLKNATTNFL